MSDPWRVSDAMYWNANAEEERERKATYTKWGKSSDIMKVLAKSLTTVTPNLIEYGS